MKLFFKSTLLALLFFSTSSFNAKNEPVADRELNLCDAVKKLVPIFANEEIKKLLEAKVVSEDETQWSSRIKIDRYKEEYIYDDGKDSYFEAVLDKKIYSVDALETEIDYIAASLEGCTWQSISSTSFAERC